MINIENSDILKWEQQDTTKISKENIKESNDTIPSTDDITTNTKYETDEILNITNKNSSKSVYSSLLTKIYDNKYSISKNAPRSLQQESNEFDTNLINILLVSIKNIFKYHRPDILTKYIPEFESMIQFLILRFSILNDKPTPGAEIQKLILVEDFSEPFTIRIFQPLLYLRDILLKIFLYIYNIYKNNFLNIITKIKYLSLIKKIFSNNILLHSILNYISQKNDKNKDILNKTKKTQNTINLPKSAKQYNEKNTIESLLKNDTIQNSKQDDIVSQSILSFGYKLPNMLLRSLENRINILTGKVDQNLYEDIDNGISTYSNHMNDIDTIDYKTIYENTPKVHHILRGMNQKLMLKSTKFLFIFYHILQTWAWKRIKLYIHQNDWAYESQNSYKYKVTKYINNIDLSIRIISVINFLTFLSSGRYSMLLHRIQGVRYAYFETSVSRTLALEVLHQQLIWNGALEFCFYFSPLIPFDSIGRWVRKIYQWGGGVKKSKDNRNQYTMNLDQKCPICDKNPIIQPHITNCGHVYCYVCLRSSRMTKKVYRTCEICHELIYKQTPLFIKNAP